MKSTRIYSATARKSQFSIPCASYSTVIRFRDTGEFETRTICVKNVSWAKFHSISLYVNGYGNLLFSGQAILWQGMLRQVYQMTPKMALNTTRSNLLNVYSNVTPHPFPHGESKISILYNVRSRYRTFDTNSTNIAKGTTICSTICSISSSESQILVSFAPQFPKHLLHSLFSHWPPISFLLFKFKFEISRFREPDVAGNI